MGVAANLVYVLEQFRAINVIRCREAFRKEVNEWSPTDWGCALAGEVGEVCNELKKLRRGDYGPSEAEDDPAVRAIIAAELADVFCYLDLTAARLGIDLGAAIVEKFNAVSERRGSDIKLK